jgi:hypothetical protein
VYPLSGLDGSRRANVSFNKRACAILGNILHEQVHALFMTYLCTGRCDGTSYQRALCRYFSSRLVHGFKKVTRMNEVWDDEYFYGHGPAFEEVARNLGKTAQNVLGLEKPIDMGCVVNKCQCIGTPYCIGHCYPDYKSQLSTIKQHIETGKLIEKRA